MISGIGGSFGSMYPGCGSAPGASSAASASSLAQTQEKLFAAIDTNGDGSVSQAELQSFFDKVSSATGNSQSDVSSLFSSLDSSGDGSISLQEFQSNAADLVTQLRSQLASASSNANSSATSSGNATSASNSSQSSHAHHHHHHGGAGEGEGSLVAQLLQQYGATSSAAVSNATGTTVSTSA